MVEINHGRRDKGEKVRREELKRMKKMGEGEWNWDDMEIIAGLIDGSSKRNENRCEEVGGDVIHRRNCIIDIKAGNSNDES